MEQPVLSPNLKDPIKQYLNKFNLNLCLTCGTCTNGCPITGTPGMEGWDTRKVLRMLSFGLVQEVVDWGLFTGNHDATRILAQRKIDFMKLAAVKTVLAGQRHRWLTGMDIHVTEHKNVYGEKTDASFYEHVLKEADRDEYHKALVLESLKSGPRSVREMASETGLPVYTVSLRLNDLERRGQADLQGFEGTTPGFNRLHA